MKAAVCLYVLNEERDIAEWLAYQLAVGFDACLVYDNGSTDRTRDVVRVFSRKHDVRLIDWPNTEHLSQVYCYDDCLLRFGKEFDWIAFVDSDELIVPREGDIKGLIDRCRDASAIILNWAMFGANGHATRPPGLMMETFTRRSPAAFGENDFFKSIVRPTATIRTVNPHAFAVKGRTVTAAGGPVEWHDYSPLWRDADHSVAQINHYFTKSREEWRRKLARGYRDGSPRVEESFSEYDRGAVEDRGALRFLPQVREIIAGVRTGPDLAERDRIVAAYRAGWLSREVAAAALLEGGFAVA